MAKALLASLILLAGPVLAETVYVTDILQLELYETMEMTGRPLKRLLEITGSPDESPLRGKECIRSDERHAQYTVKVEASTLEANRNVLAAG